MTNEELVWDFQNGNKNALSDLILKNKDLVHFAANKFSKIGSESVVDQDDLFQEGMIGLIKAAEKYNCEMIHDVKFSTYAYSAVKSHILRCINRSIPRTNKTDLMSPIIHINSLDDFIPGSEDTTWIEVLPFEKNDFRDVEREFDNEILRNDLLKLLDEVFGTEFTVCEENFDQIINFEALFERYENGITGKEILLLHYGLLGKKMTFKQLSDSLKKGIDQLSVIELNAMDKLRKSDAMMKIVELYGYDFDIDYSKFSRRFIENEEFNGMSKVSLTKLDVFLDNVINSRKETKSEQKH